MGNPLFSKLNQVDSSTLESFNLSVASSAPNLKSRIVADYWDMDDPADLATWVTGDLTDGAWVGLIALISHTIDDAALWACGVYTDVNTIEDPGFDNASHWDAPSGGGGSWTIGSSKATASTIQSGLVLSGKTANSTLLLQGTVVVKFKVSNFNADSGVPSVRCSIGSSAGNRKFSERNFTSTDDRECLAVFNMDISSGNWGGTSDEQYGQTGIVMFDNGGSGTCSFELDDVYVYQGKASNLSANANDFGGDYPYIRNTVDVTAKDSFGVFSNAVEEDATRFPALMKFNSYAYWQAGSIPQAGSNDRFFVAIELTSAFSAGRLVVSDYFQVSRAPQYGDLKELIIDDSKPERSASGGIQFDELGKKRGLEFTLKHLSEPEGLYIQHLLGTVLGQSKDFVVIIDPDDDSDSQTNFLYGRQDKPVKVKPEKVTTGDKQLFTIDWSVKEIL